MGAGGNHIAVKGLRNQPDTFVVHHQVRKAFRDSLAAWGHDNRRRCAMRIDQHVPPTRVGLSLSRNELTRAGIPASGNLLIDCFDRLGFPEDENVRSCRRIATHPLIVLDTQYMPQAIVGRLVERRTF